MNDEDTLINQAVQAALASRSPVQVDIDRHTWLVVHALADSVLVSVGLSGNRSSPVQVLQRRYGQPERLSAWLPAMLKDESLIAVRRLPLFGVNHVESLGTAGLEAARELLV